MVDESVVEKDRKASLAKEAEILRALNHPNIVNFFGWYEDPEKHYLVMEACLGGELFDRIVKKQCYSEIEARDLMRTLLDVLVYCHARGIVHRDLKPENLLLTSKVDDINVKVADFGFAERISPQKLLKCWCRTPGYMAPEIIRKRASGAPVDVWSLGVILYILLGGYPPFSPSCAPKAFSKIKKGEFVFHPKSWQDVSDDAKSLIKAMLTVDPKERITAAKGLRHPWILTPNETMPKKEINLDQLRLFNARRKLKTCISSILAAQRLHNMIKCRDIKEHYELQHELGKGSFAVVRSAVSLKYPGQVAVKCYERKRLCQRELDSLDAEIRILLSINHINILKLIDTFEDPDYYYIVVEKASGGELFNRIVEKVRYSEADAQIVIRTILDAVSYCHKRSIVHRDLKPENLLFSSSKNDTELKIADFGFAAVCHENTLLKEQCGTPAYIAPEILRHRPYDQAVDIWSIGVISFILLGGYPPFSNKSRPRLFNAIIHGQYAFHPSCWSTISAEAKDLVKKMLQVDPIKRIKALEALEHPYISRRNESLKYNNMDDKLQQIKLYNAKRKVRAGIDSVIAIQKVNKIICSE